MINTGAEHKDRDDTSAENRKKSLVDEPDTGREEADTEKKEERPFENMTEEELIARATELKESAEKNYELYLRSQAEMENMRKRWQREKEDWVKFSNESLIKDILPALDALEKAISHCAVSNEDCLDALQQGVELTLKGLKDALTRAGLETIEAKGEAFDPNYHQAVSEMVDEQAEPGSVLTELQKGYLLNQRLLRPAMVVVNKK
jgi:molecular chaperone GrpE